MHLQGVQTAIAVGTFDGVHLGHAAVIKTLTARADDKGLHSLVLTFATHPAVTLRAETPPFLLTMDRRLELLAGLGVETALVMTFDKSMAVCPPSDFVVRNLCGMLNMKLIAVGHDFHFGAGGTGDLRLLERIGGALDFEVIPVEPVVMDGTVVSSTVIRWMLSAGDVSSAQRYLGHPFTVSGRVFSGDGRGRQLGFPTANISLAPGLLWPRFGVYLVEAVAAPRGHWYGIANIGIRPTFGRHQPSVEAHLFDFDEDLYGELIELTLLSFLRPEARFTSREALSEQIVLDIDRAKEILAGEITIESGHASGV